MKKFLLKNSTLIEIIISSILTVIAVVLDKLTNVDYWVILLIIGISYVICGHKAIIKAITKTIHLDFFDENFLMSIASIGAFIINKPFEAVSVMILYNVGELFQKNAIKKSKNSIKEFANLQPNFAQKLMGGKYVKTPVEDVQIGDIIRVIAGEKIPLDSVIIEGSTSLDMSSITGESMPVDKKVGDNIPSGCINTSSVIYLKVTKLLEDSTATKIIELIENASVNKSKSENFIKKFAKIYTPVVVVLALIIGIIPPIFDGLWDTWIYRSLSFLVISCPCSIVISVPLAYFSTIGSLAKQGVLIKGGGYLDKLNTVDTFVFDKTGTLTTGKFAVEKVNNLANNNEFYTLFATMESYSNHPIANLIADKYASFIDKNLFNNATEIPGKGIIGYSGNNKIIVGKLDLLKENGVKIMDNDANNSVVYLAKNQEYLGNIIVADKLKDGGKQTISTLNKTEKNTLMLTGDNEIIANKVQKEVGVTEFYANLLPEDKLNIVEELLLKKHRVCYVGDGINDAPVLSRADVSIAMSTGSDIAIEYADIVLLNGDISKIILLQSYAKKTNRIVLENIILSISIKILVMILSTLGITSMWLAIFSDVGMLVLCVLNSIRLLRNKNVK